MRAGQPAVAVEFVVIETELADELRVLGTAAFQSRSYIEDHQPIVPVSEICKTVFDVQVMEVTPGNLFAFFGANRAGHLTLDLPACDFFRVLYVAEIDYPHRAGRVVSQVNIMAVDECAVHTAGDRRGVLGD